MVGPLLVALLLPNPHMKALKLNPQVYHDAAFNIESGLVPYCCIAPVYATPTFSDMAHHRRYLAAVFCQSNKRYWWGENPTPHSQTARIMALTLAALLVEDGQSFPIDPSQ